MTVLGGQVRAVEDLAPKQDMCLRFYEIYL